MALHRLASGFNDGGALLRALTDSIAPRLDAVFASMWLDREGPVVLDISQPGGSSLPVVTISFPVRPREKRFDMGD